MNGLLLIAATLLLFSLPGMAHRAGVRLSPADWARVIGASFTSGFVLLEVSLVLCALPLLAHVSNIQMRGHFFPGGTVAGIVSLALAIALPAAALGSILRTLRRRRMLRAEPYVGRHRTSNGVDLVVLPTDRLVAQAVAGRPPQIQVSQGLLDTFDDDLVQIIVRHELSHLRHRHDRYLLLSTGVRVWLGWVPPIRRTIDLLGLSLEEWADDDAAWRRPERARIRTILVALATADIGATATLIAPERTVLERLSSLEHAPTVSAVPGRALIFGGATMVQIAAVLPLVRWL